MRRGRLGGVFHRSILLMAGSVELSAFIHFDVLPAPKGSFPGRSAARSEAA
jgi:hypothetical protein